jgi:hypothetical protein
MRRLIPTLLFLAAAITACGGDSTGPNGSLPGTYNLQTVDTRPVPVVLFEDADYKLEITSGSFAITSGSSFTESLIIKETDSSGSLSTPVTCTGTYTRSGNTLVLTEPETDDCGGTYDAAWNGGNQLTVDYGGLVAVYRR